MAKSYSGEAEGDRGGRERQRERPQGPDVTFKGMPPMACFLQLGPSP